MILGRVDFHKSALITVTSAVIYPTRALFCLGVVMATDDMWVHNRRFTLKTLRDFGFGKSTMEEIIKDEIKDHLASLREEAASGRPVVLDEKLNISITNIIWRILAGNLLINIHNI